MLLLSDIPILFIVISFLIDKSSETMVPTVQDIGIIVNDAINNRKYRMIEASIDIWSIDIYIIIYQQIFSF